MGDRSVKRKAGNPIKRIFTGGGLLLSLCNVSLLGVGFSSWTLSGPYGGSLSIDASVGKVMNSDIFGLGSITTFELGPDGIVKDEIIVKSATLTADFYILHNPAYEVASAGVVSVEITLTCSLSQFVSTHMSNSGIAVTNGTFVSASKSGADIITSLTVPVTAQDGGSTLVSVTYPVSDSSGTMGANFASNLPTFKYKLRSLS